MSDGALNRRALVLGIGNLLIGDEGVGCRAVEELAGALTSRPRWSASMAAPPAAELLPMLDGKDHVILIDALRDEAEPGTVIMVENEQVPRAFLADHPAPAGHLRCSRRGG